jgi:hypothetical protein
VAGGEHWQGVRTRGRWRGLSFDGGPVEDGEAWGVVGLTGGGPGQPAAQARKRWHV